jgi:hypothetical protein
MIGALQPVTQVIGWNRLRLHLDLPNYKVRMHAKKVLDKHDIHQAVVLAEGTGPKLDESCHHCQAPRASSKDRVVPGDWSLVAESLPMHWHGRNNIHGGGEQDDNAVFLGMENRRHHSRADVVEVGVNEI